MAIYKVATKFNGLYIKREIDKLVEAESVEEAREKVKRAYAEACRMGREQSKKAIGERADEFPLPELEILDVVEVDGEWE